MSDIEAGYKVAMIVIGIVAVIVIAVGALAVYLFSLMRMM